MVIIAINNITIHCNKCETRLFIRMVLFPPILVFIITQKKTTIEGIFTLLHGLDREAYAVSYVLVSRDFKV